MENGIGCFDPIYGNGHKVIHIKYGMNNMIRY